MQAIWTQSQCEQKYVESNLTLQQLAEISSVSLRSLREWCYKNNWVGKRQTYLDELKEVASFKMTEQIKSKIAEDLADIAKSNYEAHKLVREYVIKIFKSKTNEIDRIHTEGGDKAVSEFASKSLAIECNYWSLSLARATQEIAVNTGLSSFININTAASRLEKEGYVVMENPDSLN